MNELKVFSNSEFGELGVMIIEGKEYFPATQCATALGYKNPKDAIIRHCKGVVKRDLPTNGGTQTVNYIPEGDLYRLIVSSKLPQAEKFESWVFDEVLPSIRQNGGYAVNIEEIITKTATAVVTEVMKQLIPEIKRINQTNTPLYHPIGTLQDFQIVEYASPKPRRKITAGIIRRLDDEIRNTVNEMLMTDKYSNKDIQAYLNGLGVQISQTAIWRYSRSLQKK